MEKKKVPALRFRGFHDDWEQRKLGDIYTERNERGDETLPILSVSIHSGVSDGELNADILGKKVHRSEDKSMYKHVYIGDLIFNMMRAWQGAIGVAKNEGISPAYISAIPNADVYPPFMNYLLRRTDTINQINNLSYGVTDFRKRLYWDSFLRVNCQLPSVEEQKCITDVFEILDHLITLHQRKYEKLQKLKKAMLEKMFPKPGCSVPEIRFQGFTDDWEQCKLGELSSVSMCRRIFKEQTTESGDIPFYKIGTFGAIADAFISKELFEEYKSKYPYPRKGDILISASGSIGRTVEFTGENEYFQDSNIVWLNHDERLSDSFLKCFYAVVKWAGIEGSTIKRLYNDNILNTPISVPSISEQEKIGSFFVYLDHLITLHQRKLEKLKNLKKACLEKMFA